ncbi:type III-B CRISPR module RAMP protein Cmr4 [Bacillus pumilus]|uniref:type III-B CRISPR module RAMP protein Cmr4 n=1 Tax=Bacillus pumilus TaxID=1408 RepID=UPI0020B433BC|nr:type III-B CRISPR module RAMP protein Cmr4 [Bacillus pumilus]
MEASRWFWIHCLSPLHIGAGEGVGVIDMPIQREKVTEWPIIPGSSIKGVQREYYRAKGQDTFVQKVFGTQGDQDGSAGAIVMTDGRLFSFPVASRYGTFAYVASPLILKRLARDAKALGVSLDIPDLIEESSTLVTMNSTLVENDELYLGEFQGAAKKSQQLTDFAKKMAKLLFDDKPSQTLWIERFVIVSDDVFQYIVTMNSEVTPRIRIDHETQTVSKGALWYEEYVPAEAIFYGLMWCDRVDGSNDLSVRHQLLNQLEKQMYLQLGGNTNVGKGRVSWRMTGGEGS